MGSRANGAAAGKVTSTSNDSATVDKDVDFANYFCTYAFLYHQKEMLSDRVRMDAYYNSVFNNKHHFIGKVKVLFEENNLLDKENRRLMKLLQKERQLNNSGGNRNSASLKNNKRKCSPRDCSPIEKRLDFSESGSPRQILSPLRHNTPESRLHKK